MWHPNRAQWWVIWMCAAFALLIWLNSPVPAYHTGEQEHRMVYAVIIVGVLLVWQFANPKSP